MIYAYSYLPAERKKWQKRHEAITSMLAPVFSSLRHAIRRKLLEQHEIIDFVLGYRTQIVGPSQHTDFMSPLIMSDIKISADGILHPYMRHVFARDQSKTLGGR